MIDEVIKYLTEHLEISVEQVTEFGPIEQIKIKLELNGITISEDTCDLPEEMR